MIQPVIENKYRFSMQVSVRAMATLIKTVRAEKTAVAQRFWQGRSVN
jgi:hypothetical protein